MIKERHQNKQKNGRQSKAPATNIVSTVLQADAYLFNNQVNYCPNDYSHSKAPNGACYQPHEVTMIKLPFVLREPVAKHNSQSQDRKIKWWQHKNQIT